MPKGKNNAESEANGKRLDITASGDSGDNQSVNDGYCDQEESLDRQIAEFEATRVLTPNQHILELSEEAFLYVEKAIIEEDCNDNNEAALRNIEKAIHILDCAVEKKPSLYPVTRVYRCHLHDLLFENGCSQSAEKVKHELESSNLDGICAHPNFNAPTNVTRPDEGAESEVCESGVDILCADYNYSELSATTSVPGVVSTVTQSVSTGADSRTTEAGVTSVPGVVSTAIHSVATGAAFVTAMTAKAIASTAVQSVNQDSSDSLSQAGMAAIVAVVGTLALFAGAAAVVSQCKRGSQDRQHEGVARGVSNEIPLKQIAVCR